MKTFADFHVHPHLKDFNHQDESSIPNIWKFYKKQIGSLKKLNFLIKDQIKGLAKHSQINLDYCYAGKVRLVFPSLMAIERQYLVLRPQRPFRTLIRLLLPTHLYTALGAVATGFPENKIQKILGNNVDAGADGGVNYFRPFRKELEYIIDQHNSSSDKYPQATFQIAQTYQDYQLFKKDPDCIVAILTVEGAHNFGDYLKNSTFFKTYVQLDTAEKERLDESMIRNVDFIKKHDYAPFFITFCHHFNNLLAGHARSLSAKSLLSEIIPMPGIRHVFNQNPNRDAGISLLGIKIIKKLLQKEAGKRRILIDTKHMSIQSRIEFYELLENHNRDHPDDNIPIIHSHGCISGWNKLDQAKNKVEYRKIDKTAYFSRWRINLTNEEILKIYDSDGMIGLILHEGRVPGEAFKKQAKKIKKCIRKLEKKAIKKINPDKKKIEEKIRDQLQLKISELADLYVQLLLSNIFHILKLIKDRKGANGWKILSLGSDYDGIVDPFDTFQDGRTYPSLWARMDTNLRKAIEGDSNEEKYKIYYANHKNEKEEISPAEIKSLLFGKSADDVLEDFFLKNIEIFLSKYFTEEYRNQI